MNSFFSITTFSMYINNCFIHNSYPPQIPIVELMFSIAQTGFKRKQSAKTQGRAYARPGQGKTVAVLTMVGKNAKKTQSRADNDGGKSVRANR